MSLFPFIRSIEETISIPNTYKEYELDFAAGQLTGKVLEWIGYN